MFQDKRIQGRIIKSESPILSALTRMDEQAVKSLMVSEDNLYLKGIISIGDIQRAIIKGDNLNAPIKSILRSNPLLLFTDRDVDEVKEMMISRRLEFLPVVDEHTWEIKKIYFWSDFFSDKVIGPASQFNLPIIIMAGGIGTRMKPLTNVIPKPLIPIHDKTIIEEIMDRFVLHGCHAFYISVNFKADMIRYYFESLNNPEYCINYFQEDQPLGTAGSLALIKNKIDKTFFVSNCDILLDEDYSEILKYHQDNRNLITVVAALKTYPIPYGTIETGDMGQLQKLEEKPELTFKINTGMYILEPEVLNDIPENEFFHITQLIEIIKSRNGKVGVFPVSEKSWIDIGNWETYKNYIKI